MTCEIFHRNDTAADDDLVDQAYFHHADSPDYVIAMVKIIRTRRASKNAPGLRCGDRVAEKKRSIGCAEINVDSVNCICRSSREA